MHVSQKRLYVNADKTEVVDESSPEAAFLLVGVGSEIDGETLTRLGLTPDDLLEAKAEATEGDETPKPAAPKRKR
jgi:hypothetical protein